MSIVLYSIWMYKSYKAQKMKTGPKNVNHKLYNFVFDVNAQRYLDSKRKRKKGPRPNVSASTITSQPTNKKKSQRNNNNSKKLCLICIQCMRMKSCFAWVFRLKKKIERSEKYKKNINESNIDRRNSNNNKYPYHEGDPHHTKSRY